MARPKPLPCENDQVVYGVSSVLLTGTAEFWARDDDAEVRGSSSAAGGAAACPLLTSGDRLCDATSEGWGLRSSRACSRTGRWAPSISPRPIKPRGWQRSKRWSSTARLGRQQLERRLPLFEQYRASLPPFVQRRHAEQLDAARERAEHGIEALQRLYRG